MHFSMNEILKIKIKINKIKNSYKIFIFINVIKLILIFKIINTFFNEKASRSINYLFQKKIFLKLYKNL